MLHWGDKNYTYNGKDHFNGNYILYLQQKQHVHVQYEAEYFLSKSLVVHGIPALFFE